MIDTLILACITLGAKLELVQLSGDWPPNPWRATLTHHQPFGPILITKPAFADNPADAITQALRHLADEDFISWPIADKPAPVDLSALLGHLGPSLSRRP